MKNSNLTLSLSFLFLLAGNLRRKDSKILARLISNKGALKMTRPSFFLGGGYQPTLKLSGNPTFTFVVSLTHRMDFSVLAEFVLWDLSIVSSLS